ncbi:hypothetical protein [Georgenia subflava]|uniref:Uncharacterized protein n=1 Tax=Georgenia subflava TaxID=1622177 RepID=A0A6N7ERN0_9MICO|nr:hypothetical protein [Georgenia subflava]MPV38776.1 hypothetical protein [Georgenia subflava]
MDEAMQCFPGDSGGGVSELRAGLAAALATLGQAQGELRAAFPSAWTGTGASAFTHAVLAILHDSQAVDRALREADRAAYLADLEVDARVSGT